MSTRSRAGPWFRDVDDVWAPSPFVFVTGDASSYDLWQQPGGDPVADMRSAMEHLQRERPITREQFDAVTDSIRRRGPIR